MDNPSIETSLGRVDGGSTEHTSIEFTLAQLNGQSRGVSAEFSAAQLAGGFKRLSLERSLAELVGLRHVSKEFAAKLLRQQGLP